MTKMIDLTDDFYKLQYSHLANVRNSDQETFDFEGISPFLGYLKYTLIIDVGDNSLFFETICRNEREIVEALPILKISILQHCRSHNCFIDLDKITVDRFIKQICTGLKIKKSGKLKLVFEDYENAVEKIREYKKCNGLKINC